MEEQQGTARHLKSGSSRVLLGEKEKAPEDKS
jgi:hypothetical protein